MRYIYCHPLFDERKCGHRFSFQLSKAYERNHLELERFDYNGTGEASGKFCDVTIESLRNDLKETINGNSVCLIGARFGATLALDYCSSRESSVQVLVLIKPTLNGQNYVEHLFRKQRLKNLMTGNSTECSDENGFYNLEGYKTSRKFIEQIKTISLVERVNCLKVGSTVHIVQISHYTKIDTEYNLLSQLLNERGIKTSIHVFNLPAFWERIPDTDYSVLTEKIVRWCGG